jgi:hypothetical protein
MSTLRTRWFASAVHVAFWVLLYLTVTALGGKTPDYHDSPSSAPVESPVPIAKLNQLFAPTQRPSPPPTPDTNSPNLFFTRQFIPAPAPAPPPPPTSRKIELTYQGFYQTGDSPRQAVVKIGDAFLIAGLGNQVTNNLFVADATFQTLTLTNLSTNSYTLSLNTKKEIEVPMK